MSKQKLFCVSTVESTVHRYPRTPPPPPPATYLIPQGPVAQQEIFFRILLPVHINNTQNVAFSLQQWLQKRATMLRHMYVNCLCCCSCQNYTSFNITQPTRQTPHLSILNAVYSLKQMTSSSSVKESITRSTDRHRYKMMS